ncbi:MAG: S8 family peptidase [Chloroflexota bacterium]
MYPLSAVHAQDEIPPTPTPEATEPVEPPVEESTPEAVIVVVTETAPATPEAEAVTETLTGLLVQVDGAVSQDELMQSLSQYGTVVQSDLNRIDFVLVNVPQSNYESAMQGLSAAPGVMLVEANGDLWLEDTIPTDPFFGDQYGLTAINAPQAWDYTTGSSSVTIAIVDSGVDLTHPDLAANLLNGYDFVNSDGDPMDDNGHGTHVAGITAAVTNNGVGVAGVAGGAQILPVKVLNASGNGTFNNVALGIIYAVNNGAQVINLSLGGGTNSAALQNAIAYADAHGVVVVAATGNTGSSVLYPAAYESVIAVAASDESNNHAAFSNYGPEVDVTAPGVNIYSTALGGGYEYRNGTSMATAYVTGEVALLLSVDSSLTPDEVVAIIESTALDIGEAGEDVYTGSGLIQVDAAVLLVIETPVAEAEEEEEKPSEGEEFSLLSPTSVGSVLPEPTLPSSTPTAPEVSAQTVIETSMPEVVPVVDVTATVSSNSASNTFPSFLIGLLAGIGGILIFLWWKRRKDVISP